MTLGRLNVRTGQKGKGKAHADYILRQDKYKSHADKLEKLELVGSGNMPQWAKDNPILFWEMADEMERKNGSVYREHIITFPREFTENEREEFVKEWVKKELGDKHPYTFAIHIPLASDGKAQAHCHLMFSDRANDGIERGSDEFFKRYNPKAPEKGGAKKLNTGLDYTTRKQNLKDQRMRLQNQYNAYLERAGHTARVDLRNWKERGLTEQPRNIPMHEIKKPQVAKAHAEKLTARDNLRNALLEIRFTFGNLGNAITDLKNSIFAPKPPQFESPKPNRTDSTTTATSGLKQAEKGQNDTLGRTAPSPDIIGETPSPDMLGQTAPSPDKKALELQAYIAERKAGLRQKVDSIKDNATATAKPEQPKAEPSPALSFRDKYKQMQEQHQAEQYQAEQAKLEQERIAKWQAEQEKLARQSEQKDEPQNKRDNSPRPF